jgi:hypothetical protein
VDQRADNPGAHEHQIAGGHESQWIATVAPGHREREVCGRGEFSIATGMKIVPGICRWRHRRSLPPRAAPWGFDEKRPIMFRVPTGAPNVSASSALRKPEQGAAVGVTVTTATTDWDSVPAGDRSRRSDLPLGHGRVILGVCGRVRRRPPGPDADAPAQIGVAVTRLCSDRHARCPCFSRTRLARSHPPDRRGSRNACVTLPRRASSLAMREEPFTAKGAS